MDILAQLFGSAAKVRLMRLFLFSTDSAFSLADISSKTKTKSHELRKELAELVHAGIVKKRSVIREIVSKKDPKKVIRKIHELGYSLDTKFRYLQALKNLLITVSLHADESLVRKFATVGKIKLFLASGIFIQEWDTRVDLLIVGDDLNLEKLDTVMKGIEAEVGKEIAYSAFDTEDFQYRYGVHDRLIRDIISAPHTVLIDKLGLFTDVK